MTNRLDNPKTIKLDRMRYAKNVSSSRLTYLAILFDVLYFVSVYESDVGSWYYQILIGASIVYNLLFMLMTFLASEGVKSRKTGFTIPLIALGAFQIIRVFYLPALAHSSTVVIAGEEIVVMGDGQYMYTIACLLISAVCCIVAAVISFMNNKKLAAHMQSLENISA